MLNCNCNLLWVANTRSLSVHLASQQPWRKLLHTQRGQEVCPSELGDSPSATENYMGTPFPNTRTIPFKAEKPWSSLNVKCSILIRGCICVTKNRWPCQGWFFFNGRMLLFIESLKCSGFPSKCVADNGVKPTFLELFSKPHSSRHWSTYGKGVAVAVSVCSHKKSAKDKAHVSKDLAGKAAEMHIETQATDVAQCPGATLVWNIAWE